MFESAGFLFINIPKNYILDMVLNTKAYKFSNYLDFLGSKQKPCIYISVTDAIHPFSVVSVIEDVTPDWLNTQ